MEMHKALRVLRENCTHHLTYTKRADDPLPPHDPIPLTPESLHPPPPNTDIPTLTSAGAFVIMRYTPVAKRAQSSGRANPMI